MHQRPAERILAIDALRGIAVLLMIEQHLGVWLWRGPFNHETILDYPGLIALNALGGLAAPLFISLAAMGSVFYANRTPDSSMVFFKRGLLLLGVGYAFNGLVSTWFSMQSWFILHLLGVGLMITPLLLVCSNSILVVLGGLTILISAPLQELFNVPWMLTNEYMAARVAATTWSPLRIPLLEGHFPIFPWLGMYLLGIIAGRLTLQKRFLTLALTGLAMMIFGAISHALIWQGIFVDVPWLYRAMHFQAPFFPASAALVILLTGAVWLSVVVMVKIANKVHLHAMHWLVVLGRISLTLLILHVWLFRQLGYDSFLWGRLSALTSFGVFVGFMLLCVFIGKQWQKAEYRLSLEWWLKKMHRH